jgi:hypothetical protein
MTSTYDDWHCSALDWFLVYLEEDYVHTRHRYQIGLHAASHGLELLLKGVLFKLNEDIETVIKHGHCCSDIIARINLYKEFNDKLWFDHKAYDQLEIAQGKQGRSPRDVMKKHSVFCGELEYLMIVKYCGEFKYIGLPLKSAKQGRTNMAHEYPNDTLGREVGKLRKFLGKPKSDPHYDDVMGRINQIAQSKPWLNDYIGRVFSNECAS